MKRDELETIDDAALNEVSGGCLGMGWMGLMGGLMAGGLIGLGIGVGAKTGGGAKPDAGGGMHPTAPFWDTAGKSAKADSDE